MLILPPRNLILVALSALLTVLIAACQSPAGVQGAPGAAEPAEAAAAAAESARPYTLGIGDAMDVKLFYHPELNESLTVLPDGRISVQLVGEVTADGKTPEQLARELEEKYTAAGLRGPRVAVIVRKSAGRKVFVGGEVQAPKLVAFEGRLSLVQAIIEAGGLKSTAAASEVVLLRDNGKGGATVRNVNVGEIMRGATDIALQPYDVVVVPKSTIAKINEFVEQYIVKVIPIQLYAGFNYVRGHTSTDVPVTTR